MRERLLSLFPVLLLVLAAHLAFQHFSVTLLGGAVGAALLALALLTVTGSGRLLLRSLGVTGASESEKTLAGATLGLGLLTQGMMLLGVLGLLKTWAVSLLLGVFWVVGFTEMRDVLSSLTGNRSLLRDRPVLAGGTLLVLGLLFWLAWVPPHHYDALVYHLALPSAYVSAGRIFIVDHLLYTHFPQNAEMLYTLALLLGSDLLAQMFTWLGTLLSVWWLLEMGKRQLPVTVVLLACFLTVTHTAVMLLTPSAYVECLVMLWITAAVLSFLRWRVDADEADAPRGWLMLSGIFAGLGVGTKYYAGICPALLALYLLVRWLRSEPWRPSRTGTAGRPEPLSRLKDGVYFCGLAFISGAPWLVKNAVCIGNPVYPFLYKLFPARGVEWASAAAARYFEVLREYGHDQGGFLTHLLQFPYLAASGSARFGGGADVLGDLGWGLLFAAAPAAVWAAWRKRYLRWMLLYCAAHWVLWYGTGTVLRFLVPLVPLLSLPVAAGLHQAWHRMGAAGRGLLGGAVGVLLWTNLALFVHVNAMVGSFSAVTGVQSRHRFLSEKLDYYPCAAFARERLGQNDRILVVGEQRGFYVRQPVTTTTLFAPNRYVRAANEASDPAGLARWLREDEGFRYVMVVPREAQRLDESQGALHFSERGYANWAGLEERWLEPVYQRPGRCVLLRLHGPDQS